MTLKNRVFLVLIALVFTACPYVPGPVDREGGLGGFDLYMVKADGYIQN